MLKILYRNIFDKDIKRAIKRGKNIEKLKRVITALANEEMLPIQLKDHSLKGNYANHRECHIESDWLLIYKKDNNTLILERTGSHADLFK